MTVCETVFACGCVFHYHLSNREKEHKKPEKFTSIKTTLKREIISKVCLWVNCSPPLALWKRGEGALLPGRTFQTPVGMEEFSSSFFFVSSVLYSNLLSVRSTFPASFRELFFAFFLCLSILIAKEDSSGDGEPLRWLHFLVLFFLWRWMLKLLKWWRFFSKK